METQECNTNKNLRQIYSDFMLKIAKFEELVTSGSKLILDFQQGLDFLRRPPIVKKSAFLDQIVKSNENKRLSSYLKDESLQVLIATANISRLDLSYRGLKDYLTKGESIIDELEGFVLDATAEVRAATENSYSDDKISLKELLICVRKYDDDDYAAVMAILYGMVKQDYIMQEKIVSSLSLKSSSGELESYSMMWSLRPFIDEDFMVSAWKRVL